MPLDQVLFECLAFLVHRDHMNAAVHCGPVRYSPLTFQVAEALADLDPETTKDPYVNGVLAYVGRDDEDTGR